MMMHPDRLLPADPATRDVAKRLFERVEGLPIVSPHGHTDPAWFARRSPPDNTEDVWVAVALHEWHHALHWVQPLATPYWQAPVEPWVPFSVVASTVLLSPVWRLRRRPLIRTAATAVLGWSRLRKKAMTSLVSPKLPPTISASSCSACK
jgi:hypothetical protein